MASLAVSIGASLGSAVMGQIAQHSLRLKDATAENQAVPQALQAMQQDFDEIASALSSGDITPSEGIQLLDQSETAILKYLQSLVGKPGTAWSGQPSGCPGSDVPKTENGLHPCGKTCTVGCCIYFSYIEPAFDCFIKRLQKGGSQGVHVPAIPGNKYGFQPTQAYTVSWKPGTPSITSVTGLSQSVFQTFSSIASQLGLASTPTTVNGPKPNKLLLYLLIGVAAFFVYSLVGEK
jgi:hypothetical protein